MGLKSARTLLVFRLGLAVVAAPALLAAQSADDLIKFGRAQLDSGKADEAVKTLEKAVKANPQNANAHLYLGNALGNVAQKASVLRQPFLAKRLKGEFEKAVELDPNLIDGHEGLMQFYLQAPGVMGGSLGKAREQAAAVAKINPYRGRFAEASIANHEKDLAGAEKAYRVATADFPDSARAMTSLAAFLSNNNRGEEAFPVIDRYLAKWPNGRLGLWWVGRTASITGKQLDRGEQALRTVLSSPETENNIRIPRENVHYRLGDIYAKRGDKQKARAEYEAALKINPKLEPAKKGLAAL